MVITKAPPSKYMEIFFPITVRETKVRERRLFFLMLIFIFGWNTDSLAASNDNDVGLPFLSYKQLKEPQGNHCLNPFDVNAPIINNGFAADIKNTRNFQSIVKQSNVGDLTLKFVDSKSKLTERRGAPFINAQSIVFIEGNRVTAINRETGCQYWSHTNSDAGVYFRSSAVVFSAAENNMPALIFVGDANGYVHALNANNGMEQWKIFAGTDPRLHYITGGLQLYQDKLFVPVSSKEVFDTKYNSKACCSSHGMLVKIDIASGKIDWRYHTTAEATIKTSGRIGPSGAPVWTTPAIDPKRNAVYIGTGENYSEPPTNTSDAIISIDIDSGQSNWIFQATANDMWNLTCNDKGRRKCPSPMGQDFDFGASPILINDGDHIVAGDKGGTVYLLDADSGLEQWRVSVGTGSTLGGIHWGMAVDNHHIYAAVSDFEVDKLSGQGDLVADARPGIYAVDINTGGIVWDIHPTHVSGDGLINPSLYSASLSITNDILFAASLDGVVKAFATEDGRELFSFDSDISFTNINGESAEGGTIDSVGVIVAGDGIVVSSGYDSFNDVELQRFQGGKGNALLVFSLPEKLSLGITKSAVIGLILVMFISILSVIIVALFRAAKNSNQ